MNRAGRSDLRRKSPATTSCQRPLAGRRVTNHVHFAEEGIAPRVVIFGRNGIEQQVTEVSEFTSGIGDTHAVLSSTRAIGWPGIDRVNQFPAAGCRVGMAIGGGIELGIYAIAGKQGIDLQPARGGLPRGGGDLRDLKRSAHIQDESSAITARL